MIPLPPWVPVEAWDEYVAQRIKDKKAMTQRSAIGRLKRLSQLRDAGHDVEQCLDEAINGHWLDFYVPKEKPIERAASSAAESTRARLDERSAIVPTPPPAQVLALARKLRSTA